MKPPSCIALQLAKATGACQANCVMPSIASCASREFRPLVKAAQTAAQSGRRKRKLRAAVSDKPWSYQGSKVQQAWNLVEWMVIVGMKKERFNGPTNKTKE